MTHPADRPAAGWTIVVPVKMTHIAKSRLADLGPRARRSLALAFALDAVTAAKSCPQVGRVLAVTNDVHAAEPLRRLGVDVVPDSPDSGLNAALAFGVGAARSTDPDAPVAAMSADLPALRPAHLTRAIDAAAGSTQWLVSDLEGTGTTLLAADRGGRFAPAFGVASRAAHLASGAVDVSGPGMEGLRRDVDTESNLWSAARLGLGRHTLAALDRLGVAAGKRSTA